MRFALRRDRLASIYALGVLGALLQITGGTWDVASHIVRTPETFFTPQHDVLYTGIALALAASGAGFLLRGKTPTGSADRALLKGLGISWIGGGIQIVAGPFDFWWHSTYGFDPHLLTPAHTLLISGIIIVAFGMAIGSVRLLEARRRGLAPGGWFFTEPWLAAMVAVSLAALWMALNGLIYLLLDTDGYDYTFHLGPGFVAAMAVPMFAVASILLAAPGTFILFTAKRVLPRHVAVAVPILVVGTGALANVGFRGWFLSSQGNPFGGELLAFLAPYVAFVVPVLAFVWFVPANRARIAILAAGLVGPFVSYLDGFYSSVLWTSLARLIRFLLVPMILVGLAAGLTHGQFASLLSLPPADSSPVSPATS